MDPYGLIVLLICLIIVSAFLTAGIFGTMYAIHKFAADKIPYNTYRNFNFDDMRKEQLSEFLVRIAAITFSPTIAFHVLEFLTVGVYIRAYPGIVTLTLFILETAAFAAGFMYILRVDRIRVVIFTSVASALYICLYWILIFQYLR